MLPDLKIAWRNVWRNPRRSILTASAVIFSCVLLIFMVSLQMGSYSSMIDSAVKIQTGHLQVQAKGYQKDGRIRQVIPHPERVSELLSKDPLVDAFTFRSRAFALVSSKDRTYGAMVVGVDPKGEERVSTIPSVVRRGSYFTTEDEAHVVLGEILADNLSVGLGDELVILGQGYDGSVAANVLNVKGIFSSGQTDFDRNVIEIPLSVFQNTFSMGDAVHEIVITSVDLEQVDVLASRLNRELEGLPDGKDLIALTWEELMPGLEQMIRIDMFSAYIFYGILIVVVAFSIMNTFITAIMERTRELGVLLAVGVRRSRLIRMVLMESVFLTMLGVTAGVVLGLALTSYFEVHGINMGVSSEVLGEYGLPSVIKPKITLGSAISGPLIVFVVTLCTAVFPALRILKLRIVKALTAV